MKKVIVFLLLIGIMAACTLSSNLHFTDPDGKAKELFAEPVAC
jgi:hypothetical protein